MDDQALVSKLHRRADGTEQAKPLGNRKVFLVAIPGDGTALHVLHHEIGQSAVRGAAVEQARDVGVLESGEDLPFGPEPAQDLLGVHAGLEDFERDPLLELPVDTDGEIDDTHPAVAEALQHLVRTEALPNQGIQGRRRRLFRQEITTFAIRGEQ